MKYINLLSKKIITGGKQLLDPVALLQKLGLEEGMKVADFGCGTVGHFVFPAAKLVGEKGQVYAVDILKSVLEGVRSRAELERAANVKTVWSNLEVFGATDIPDNFLDRALLVNILFQTRKHNEVLREVARMLKTGGRLLVVDWKMTRIPAFGPAKQLRLSREAVFLSAGKLGLDLVSEFEAGDYHFGLLFRKQ